jgi:hypothetical protein
MKLFLISALLAIFTVQPAHAQATNALTILNTNDIGSAAVAPADADTNNPAVLAPPPFTTELTRPFAPWNLAPLEPKPNEVGIGNVRASGIAIEAIKTGDPLRLVNPLNPPTNSSPEDNVVRDPFTGKVNGWSVFTIRF